ncbi:MAG: hypothetical protein RJB66_2560 [Pseudomonadota bacterium]
MKSAIKFLIGVDGGGSGTRVIVARDNSLEIIASAEGEPSALSLGVDKAWKATMKTIAQAFADENMNVPMLSECAIGFGLSGANNILWKNEFYLRNPGFKEIVVDTDGYTTLIGAHSGAPGVIAALGTGSVGMVLDQQGRRKSVSGWGFPSGDEASGSWLGMKAAALAQKTFDGRKQPTALTEGIKNLCGRSAEEFLYWLGNAKQTHFAALAPLIFENASNDREAYDLLVDAGKEIALMVHALDPSAELPLSICGRLGEALIPFLPPELKQRHQSARGDSTMGALYLISQKIKS